MRKYSKTDAVSHTNGNSNPAQADSTADTGVLELLLPYDAHQEAALDAFGLWMDAELDQLVTTWKHLAAPSAESSRRVFR